MRYYFSIMMWYKCKNNSKYFINILYFRLFVNVILKKKKNLILSCFNHSLGHCFLLWDWFLSWMLSYQGCCRDMLSGENPLETMTFPPWTYDICSSLPRLQTDSPSAWIGGEGSQLISSTREKVVSLHFFGPQLSFFHTE